MGTEAVPGRFLATANGDEERGSQGTVTKEPLPWNLHLTPACWIVGCQGQGSEDTDTWAVISTPHPLLIPHLTQAPSPPVVSRRVLSQNPVLFCPLCVPPPSL